MTVIDQDGEPISGAMNPFTDISPDDMGGLYYRFVHQAGAVCIQYIVYFYYQHWVPSIFDKFSGKLPGEHPNDYVPIFVYVENETPTKAVFGSCHYEAVGSITASSELLSDKPPQFHIRNFYRGLLPLGDTRGYSLLKGDPTYLSEEHLTSWWNGQTVDGLYHEKAHLIINEKLKNPFQNIETFRDQKGSLGILFDAIFRLKAGRGLTVSAAQFFPEDVDSAEALVDECILERPDFLEYVAINGHND